ncbi:MAG: sigma 54-interacting transcriptional regulator [Mitsuokella sp.]
MLFVAPTEDMKHRVEGVLADLHLSMPVIVSCDKNVIADAKEYGKIDVVISRGGIAEELKKLPGTSVVELGTSLNDLLRAAEMLQAQGCHRIGIVMRANILFDKMHDFQIGDTKLCIYPCETYEAIEATVRTLDEKGMADGIAGCMYAVHVAKSRHMLCTYVDSCSASILRAVREAVRIVRAKQDEALQAGRMSAVVQNIQEGIVLLDERQCPIFCNENAKAIFSPDFARTFHAEMDRHIRHYQGEQLIDVCGQKLLFQMVPLEMENHIENRVLIFQKMETVMKSEQKIHASLYQKGLYAKLHFSDILTHTPKMEKIIEMAEKYARTEANVLIYGETGTGKEGMAQSLHNGSRRADGPFVSVNCTSIPRNLMESELFGYVEGAFTGARRSGRKGLFELADKGTIFLDEIGELPLDVQSRLLRVLQEHEIMRVGGDAVISLDIRVICATNQDLFRMVEEGTFREDLYYRINVLNIHLPPLRERKADILPLMRFYFERYAAGAAFEERFDRKLKKRLMEYLWPGNIRELRNLAEVFACYAGEPIEEEQLQEWLPDRSHKVRTKEKEGEKEMLSVPLGIPLKEVEQEVIRQMLERFSPEEVCAKLGISRVTLWRKCKYEMFQK